MKKLSDAEEKIEYAEYELQNELKRSKEKD